MTARRSTRPAGRRLRTGAAVAVAAVLVLAVLAILFRGHDVRTASVPDPARAARAAVEAPAPEKSAGSVLRPALAPPDDDGAPPARQPAEDPAPAERTQTGEGTLEVLVLLDTTGDPLPAVPLGLEVLEEAADFLSGRPRGRPLEARITDAEGKARFRVPAGVRLVLLVRGVQAGGEDRTSLVGALVPDEHRSLVLSIPAPRLARFFGLVLGGRPEVALAGVSVVVEGRRYAPDLGCWVVEEDPERFGATRSDAAGVFALPHASTLLGSELVVDCPGYAPVRVQVPRGCDSPAEALVVRLMPAASLVVRLVERDAGPRTDLSLVLFADDLPGSWTSEADVEGSYTFERLPAATPLRPTILGSDVKRALAPVELDPGELRIVTWVLDAGCRVTGIVLDEAGQGVPLAQLAVSPADDATKEVLKTFCDEEGEFTLQRLAAGRWVVSATAIWGTRRGQTVERRDPPPSGSVELTLAPEEREKRIELVVRP